MLLAHVSGMATLGSGQVWKVDHHLYVIHGGPNLAASAPIGNVTWGQVPDTRITGAKTS
jgi:hypothetical protein